MVSLSGKIALITGASRGLGKAIAIAFGKAESNVILTDLLIENEQYNPEDLAKYSKTAAHFAKTDITQTLTIANELSQAGIRSMGLKMDVTQPTEIHHVISQIMEQFGRIDILVNNAGVMDNLATFENQDNGMWERDLNVNLTGSFNCIKAVWPQMKKQRWGRIINISSFVALSGALAQPGYGASKAGMIGLTKSLALEGAKHGITVNAVLPGFIGTEAVKLHDPKIIDRITQRIPAQRMGAPEEVASLVAFLASEHSSYMTGTAIPVTGGADLFHF